MELGLEFDDDDLKCEVNSSKSRQPLVSYHAKICTPRWFDNCENTNLTRKTADKLEELLTFKFSADYHYHQKQYELAATKYKQALDLVQPNAASTRLDIYQSLARCYLYSGKTEESIQILNSLIKTAQNVDQHRQCLLLQHQICVFSYDWAGAVSAVQKLITTDPLYAQFWLQLAEAYSNSVIGNSVTDEITDEITVKLVTCYVRARLLLKSVYRHVGPFVQERNNHLVAEINNNISKLPITELELKQATEFLLRDIRFDSENDADDDQQDKTTNKVKTSEDESFETRWFQWSTDVTESFSQDANRCDKVS